MAEEKKKSIAESLVTNLKLKDTNDDPIEDGDGDSLEDHQEAGKRAAVEDIMKAVHEKDHDALHEALENFCTLRTGSRDQYGD